MTSIGISFFLLSSHSNAWLVCVCLPVRFHTLSSFMSLYLSLCLSGVSVYVYYITTSRIRQITQIRHLSGCIFPPCMAQHVCLFIIYYLARSFMLMCQIMTYSSQKQLFTLLMGIYN